MKTPSTKATPRRRLLTEARILLRYVCDEWPDCWTCRLYVRALEQHVPSPEPLALPRLASRFPRLLALQDDTAFASTAATGIGLRNFTAQTGRLYLAFAIAEANPRLAASFLLESSSGRLGALVSLARAVAFEWLIFGLAALRATRREKPQAARANTSDL